MIRLSLQLFSRNHFKNSHHQLINEDILGFKEKDSSWGSGFGILSAMGNTYQKDQPLNLAHLLERELDQLKAAEVTLRADLTANLREQ